MAERAQVTSVEAVEAFRADLIVYLARVRALIEEVSTDLRRTQLWLETEQRSYWDRQVRRREQELEEAEATLFSARLSNLREASAAEQAAVHKARRALSEAEDRRQAVRRWIRELDHRSEALKRQVTALDTVISHDMAQAVAWLNAVVASLDAYVGTRLRPADEAAGTPPKPGPSLAPTQSAREEIADKEGES